MVYPNRIRKLFYKFLNYILRKKEFMKIYISAFSSFNNQCDYLKIIINNDITLHKSNNLEKLLIFQVNLNVEIYEINI